MADLLQQASDWLEERRTQHASHAVTYVRGVQSVVVPAGVGKTVYDVDDSNGVMVRYESRDFLIPTAMLVIGGTPTLPQRGDQIRETEGQQTFVYEVTAPSKEPCWRYSDAFRKTLRVHSKQISTEATP